MKKLIVCDFDGTLYQKDNPSGFENVLKTIENSDKNGVCFAVATGRPLFLVKDFFKSVYKDIFIISCDGALITKNDEVLYSRPVDKETVFSASAGSSDGFVACGRQCAYVKYSDYAVYKQLSDNLGGKVLPFENLSADDDIYKIFFVNNRQTQKNTEISTPGSFVRSTYMKNGILEFASAEADKAKAAEFLMQNHGISRKNVFVFGNGDNDLPLFKAFENSYADTSSPMQVKQAASHIFSNIQKEIEKIIFDKSYTLYSEVQKMKILNFKEPAKSPRIDRLKEDLFVKMPEIESSRAVLLTESYKQTENLPIVKRRSAAFSHILKNIPIIIRYGELVVGSATISPRSCQVFPEFSYKWLEDEFETVATRSADPFYISEKTVADLKQVYPYWEGKTTSDLASALMADEAKSAIDHNIFTPGNYYYNGVGHVTVDYAKVLKIGFNGIIDEIRTEMKNCNFGDGDYASKTAFYEAALESCEAVIAYAKRYAALAKSEAENCGDAKRKQELLTIAENCENVPANGATSFYEACQSFWFVQMLLQTESSGHSISPGRFDQYMYPYFKKDIDSGKITYDFAQELMDCIWIKLNDLNKVRDAASAEGFAGYSLFQNLIAGGQTPDGRDATNELSFMSIYATMHVMLPQPSFSVRVWNGTPQNFLIEAAKLTRTGVGLPAYYNDEVIIPSLVNRGLTLEEARDYNIIGCVEPQKSGKTDGWHDAAFFNMCRPLELVFSNGYDKGEKIGPSTGDVTTMTTFDEFYDAYKTQMNYMISLLVNADNAIDEAHAKRCPLPFLSCMVDDCIKRGKTVQEGGAVYNFTGPQGFGIANMADALFAVKKLVFEDKKISMEFLKQALAENFGKGDEKRAFEATCEIAKRLAAEGKTATEAEIKEIFAACLKMTGAGKDYSQLLDMIDKLPKFGNDIDEIDAFARDVAYTYTRPLEQYKNPRGGQYQAGLYPVSANVPLGAQTGATPDGRYAYTPVADGVSPCAGRDVNGPTASANSVSKLDHYIASNGTLFNMKFHPSALKGQQGLENFVSLIRGYFDQKGSHMQFNVVSRETLRDAQAHPENYKNLVVRVAGYSALFTTLSRSLQEDIISRTEQAAF